MGAVYRSFHPQLNRPVAVKVILGGAADPQAHQRFLREAQVVAGLSHPNIINIFDVDIQDGQPYIVMDYVAGGSLSRRLASGPMPVHEAIALLMGLMKAPIQKFVRTLAEPHAKMVRTVAAIRDQKQAAG